jgi:hypothetical protein
MYHDKSYCYLVIFAIVYHVYWCETQALTIGLSIFVPFLCAKINHQWLAMARTRFE